MAAQNTSCLQKGTNNPRAFLIQKSKAKKKKNQKTVAQQLQSELKKHDESAIKIAFFEYPIYIYSQILEGREYLRGNLWIRIGREERLMVL